MVNGWIGIDLDGMMASYSSWKGGGRLGEPIPAMAERVKQWLAEGRDVRIVTERVDSYDDDMICYETQRIQDWAEKYFKARLPVTCCRDYAMIELWVDRAVRVEVNTGRHVGDNAKLRAFVEDLAEHGFRCDMNPILDLQDYARELFAKVQDQIKERARQALG